MCIQAVSVPSCLTYTLFPVVQIFHDFSNTLIISLPPPPQGRCGEATISQRMSSCRLSIATCHVQQILKPSFISYIETLGTACMEIRIVLFVALHA